MKPWTEQDCATLTALYPDVDRAAQELGRTSKSVLEKALKMGLRRRQFSPKRNWVESEVKFMLTNYGPMSARQIGEALGRPTGSIEGKLRELARAKHET